MNQKTNKKITTRALKKIVTITVLSLASFFMFCLIMTPLIGFCADVANFLKGIFGLSFYGLNVAVITVCALLLAGKKIVLQPKYVADLTVLYFCVIWLVHLVTSQIYISTAIGYSQYLSTCFNYADNPTFGGLFGGIFVFPFAKLSIVFAYILFVLGIILTSLFAVNVFYKGEETPKKRENNRYRDDDDEEDDKISERKASPDAPKQKPIVTSMDILYGNQYQKPGEVPEKTSREQSFEESLTKNSSFLDLFPTKTTKNYDTAPQSKFDNDFDGESNPILQKPAVPYSEYDREIHEKHDDKPELNDDEQLSFDKKITDEIKPIDKTKSQNELKLEQARRDFEAVRAYPKAPNNAPIIDGDTYGKKPTVDTVADSGVSDDHEEAMSELDDKINQDALTFPYNTNDEEELNDDQSSEEADKTESDNDSKPIKFTEKPFIANENVKAFQGMIDLGDNAKTDDLHKYRPYIAPSIELLNNAPVDKAVLEEDFEANARVLEQTLSEFKIDAKVHNIVTGPTVTRYELSLAPGISIKKISNLTEDITRRLSAIGSVRLETTISGKDLFGIEVPNKKTEVVTLRSIIQSDAFNRPCNGLRFALGIDIGGQCIAPDLADMPHLLVAGSTGTGKSVCLNSLIISLMYRYSPEELRFILIDPKRVEFFIYNKMPHLMINEVITEHEKAITAFTWAIDEMERRYTLFAAIGAKDISTYNRIIDTNTTQKLPRIVMVVDELSELIMFNKNEVEMRIKTLSAKARAAGIHLVLATQRPSVDIITGVIKANLPSRIALRVFSTADSKTILDQGGPEKLLGKGDMLIVTGNTPKPVRLQGALVTMNEVERVVEFVKRNNELYVDQDIESKILRTNQNAAFEDDGDLDPLFVQALEYIVDNDAGVASISMLQRRFSIGYNRAGKIIEDMEQKHFVSGYDGSKSRKVLITKEEFDKLFKDE